MSAWTEKRDAFWNTVEDWVSSLEGRIEGLFSAGAAAIAKSVKEQEPKIEGDVTGFLKKAASDSVVQAENSDVSSQAKMTLALQAFWGILKTVGLTLAENESRLLLEGALMALKAAV